MVRIGSIIIVHLSKLWKAKLEVGRLQGTSEIDHCWECSDCICGTAGWMSPPHSSPNSSSCCGGARWSACCLQLSRSSAPTKIRRPLKRTKVECFSHQELHPYTWCHCVERSCHTHWPHPSIPTPTALLTTYIDRLTDHISTTTDRLTDHIRATYRPPYRPHRPRYWPDTDRLTDQIHRPHTGRLTDLIPTTYRLG